MKTFIKKQEYNYIKKCLFDLNNTFRSSIDINVIEATKGYLNEKILSIIPNLSEEEKAFLDITQIDDPLHINIYLSKLNEFVYGMPNITNKQLSNLFKKEKKLKFPSSQDYKKVFLGWIDEGTKKLFVAYNLNGKLVGMACRIPNDNSNHVYICTLCNHMGHKDEVAFVSPICKTDNIGEGSYKSIGFNMCLDSTKCNDRIVSIERLEGILKEVNNIKE